MAGEVARRSPTSWTPKLHLLPLLQDHSLLPWSCSHLPTPDYGALHIVSHSTHSDLDILNILCDRSYTSYMAHASYRQNYGKDFRLYWLPSGWMVPVILTFIQLFLMSIDSSFLGVILLLTRWATTVELRLDTFTTRTGKQVSSQF